MALVESEVRENIGILTLNDHAKRNSLSEPLVEALLEGLEQMKAQKIPVVILRSTFRNYHIHNAIRWAMKTRWSDSCVPCRNIPVRSSPWCKAASGAVPAIW